MSEFLPTCFCGMMIWGREIVQMFTLGRQRERGQQSKLTCSLLRRWLFMRSCQGPVLRGRPWCWGWGGPSSRCTSPPAPSSSPCRWKVKKFKTLVQLVGFWNSTRLDLPNSTPLLGPLVLKMVAMQCNAMQRLHNFMWKKCSTSRSFIWHSDGWRQQFTAIFGFTHHCPLWF